MKNILWYAALVLALSSALAYQYQSSVERAAMVKELSELRSTHMTLRASFIECNLRRKK